jgi:ABC-2 type transport system permease protein
MKFFKLVQFDFKSRTKSLLILGISLFLFFIMMGASYSSLATQYADLFTNAPPVFEAFVGDIANIGTPAGFLGVEMFSIMVPVMFVVISIGYGSGALASEIESGSIELLLSRNLSRTKLISSKILNLILMNFVLVLFSWAGVALSTLFFDFNISLTDTFMALMSGFLLSLTFGALAMLISVITKRKDLSLGVTTGVFTIMYVWSSMANVIEKIQKLDFLSAFKFYDASRLLEGNYIFGGSIVLIILSLVIFGVSIVIFNQEDM